MGSKIAIDPSNILISIYDMVSYAEHFSEEECNIIENTFRSMARYQDPELSMTYFHNFLLEEHFELLTCPNCHETCLFKWLALGYHKHSVCGYKWMETPWRTLWENIKRLFGPTKFEVKGITALSLLALPLQFIVYFVRERSKARGEIRGTDQLHNHLKQTNQIVDIGAGASLTLVMIHPGTFMMGGEEQRPDEQLPAHRVSFDRGFWLGKYPVTQTQYRAVTGLCPSKHEGDDHPVENLSWEEAQAFLDALNKLEDTSGGEFRFPTEAEWEYACRAGNTGRYCFGNDESALCDYAWFGEGIRDGRTHPVGKQKPNVWGLHDMHGNVGEWCADEWHDNYVGAPCNGSARQDGDGDRIVRGGHFLSSAESCRSAARDGREPNGQFEFVGFRIARTTNN